MSTIHTHHKGTFMNDKIAESLQRFHEIAEKNGMAVTGTTDGYVFMFKRTRLTSMLLSSTSPGFPIDIQTPEGVKQIVMDRNKLQAEVDAHTDQSMIMIIYTHEPIKN